MQNTYPYSLVGTPNHNCCSYVLAKLIDMGVDIAPQSFLDLPLKASVLKNKCDRATGMPKKGLKVPREMLDSDTKSYRVMVNDWIAQRLVNYKLMSFFGFLWLNDNSMKIIDERN